MDDERISNINVLFKMYDIPYRAIVKDNVVTFKDGLSLKFLFVTEEYFFGKMVSVSYDYSIEELEKRAHIMIAEIQAAREGDIVGVNSD